VERFADLVAAHVLARCPPAIVVNTADLDTALLRDMLAKAAQMPMDPASPAAHLAFERSARIAAQTENEHLKAQCARSGVELRRAVREAVLAEREACAIACEVHAAAVINDGKQPAWAIAHECAAAVRKRGAA